MSLARLESGHTPSRRHPEWWGGDVPWLALPDIRKLHGEVGKKTPLTLQHFNSFFDLLARRGEDTAEGDHSWTVDFAARRAAALAEAAPFRREADVQRERVLALKDQAKAARAADDKPLQERLATEAAAAERLARDALAKAQAIEDAIYDLKAVNPRERKTSDERTPMQLLAAIDAQGRAVDEALARLRGLLEAPPSP